LLAIVGRLPLPVGLWLGRRFGDAAYVVVRRRRQLALENLARAYPALPRRARTRLARHASQHLGMTLFELARVLTRPVDDTLQRIRLQGVEHLTAAMAAHGRALLLTAHLGNWELLAAAHRLTGFPLSIVVRPLDAPWLDALADRLRRSTGVELIDKRGALRPVLDALRRGRMIGILMDQNAARREGVFVDFFGWPASTSRSIALLALRTRTPVVPVFARRDAEGRHTVVFHPALSQPASNGSEAAVVELTARCTAAIERAIRETPEQWLWSHDRWRTRPPGEARA
jgi:Kdo2-lipid IVA lauroyltransferase/acyltransferase